MHRTAARKGMLRPLPPMDLPFLVLVLTLVAFGLVMLCSASSAVALYRRQDAFAYVRPQLLYAAMGLGAMWMASRVDYHIYHKLAWPLLALSLVLLTAVLFMPEYNGCKRWLVLPGLGTLQPSEIAKFAVVLVFAHIIALNHDRMGSFAVGVVPFALVLGVVAVLMLLEPHLSGTVLILSIGAVLMFVGGTGLRWFMLAGAGGAAAIGTAIVLMPELVPYAADRLNSWLDPFADPLGDGHQTIQSLYAIGSGGAVGLGLGNSRQKHLFVPDSFFRGTLDEFWKNLPSLDADFERRRKVLESEGKRWRFVSRYENGKASVELCEVGREHPFYTLEGSNNIILLTTERYKEYPMQIQGYGAGAGVTAAGVFADIMSIANV